MDSYNWCVVKLSVYDTYNYRITNMNNKAQVSSVAFMLAIVILILALAFVPAMNETTTDVMNETNTIGEVGGLNCTSSTISDFTKATCWVVDINQAYIIGGLIAIAGVVIASRILWA